ncbi:unnamed protein product, partial [Porites lobata]
SFYSSILEKLHDDSMDVSAEVSANSGSSPRRNPFCPVRTPKKLKEGIDIARMFSSFKSYLPWKTDVSIQSFSKDKPAKEVKGNRYI